LLSSVRGCTDRRRNANGSADKKKHPRQTTARVCKVGDYVSNVRLGRAPLALLKAPGSISDLDQSELKTGGGRRNDCHRVVKRPYRSNGAARVRKSHVSRTRAATMPARTAPSLFCSSPFENRVAFLG
jgi:hypothetical protein